MTHAVIVLGRKLDNDLPTDIYKARLDCAAEHIQNLIEEGLEYKLIISGGTMTVHENTKSEARAGFEYLIDIYQELFNENMEGQEVVLDEIAEDTFGNIIYPSEIYLPILKKGGQLDIVTSGYHMPRAYWLFEYILDRFKDQITGIVAPSISDSMEFKKHSDSEAKKRADTIDFLTKHRIYRGDIQKTAKLLEKHNKHFFLDGTPP